MKSKLIDLFDTTIKNRLNAADAMETREARLGKEFVGSIDNTRDKVLNQATATLELLESSGRDIDGKGYRNMIETFGAVFSQDSISSKKFNIETEIERQFKENSSLNPKSKLDRALAEEKALGAVNERWLKIVDMTEALMNPTDDNVELFRQHNNEIQLFDTSNPEKMKVMEDSLSKVQDVAKWNASSKAYNNTSLLMSVSEGQGSEVAKRFLSGQGDMVVPTQAMKTIIAAAPEEVAENLNKSVKRWENSVLQNFDNVSGGADSLVASLGSRGLGDVDHTLSGATIADEASVKFREVVGKFTPKIGGGGIGGGAVAFGAMWAASALIRSGPTPEGLREQTQQAPPPVAPQAMQAPTARISQNNGEYVNIQVSAKNAKGMSEQEIAAIVHQEIGGMTSMKMDTTLNINDNMQNIDQQWLQGVVANAIDKGFGF